MCVRMNLVETHLWQNDDWKDQYVGVVPRGTSGNKVKNIVTHIVGNFTSLLHQPIIILDQACISH